MLTLGQMLRVTPKKIWRASREVRVKIVESKFGKHPENGPFFESVIRAKTSGIPKTGKRDVHRVIIRQYGPSQSVLSKGGILTTRKSWVHCSCPYFLFHCEFSLTLHKSSSIIDSNGKPPVITNPRNLPRICKHLVSVIAIQPNLRLPIPELDTGVTPRVVTDSESEERKPTPMEKKLLDLLGD